MNKLTRTALLGFAVSAFALTGCATSGSCCGECGDEAACAGCDDASCEACNAEAASMGASNDACPFTGGPVNGSVETVSFGGEEIGFCCGGCQSKFAAMTDAERTAALGG